MTASYPYTVDIYEASIGAYVPVARFATVKEARAHWLTLTLDGQNAEVTRHA